MDSRISLQEALVTQVPLPALSLAADSLSPTELPKPSSPISGPSLQQKAGSILLTRALFEEQAQHLGPTKNTFRDPQQQKNVFLSLAI